MQFDKVLWTKNKYFLLQLLCEIIVMEACVWPRPVGPLLGGWGLFALANNFAHNKGCKQ